MRQRPSPSGGPPRDEWDFRPSFDLKGDDGKNFKPDEAFQPLVFLSDGEVHVCLTYEFERQNKNTWQYVLDWRKPSGARSFNALIRYRRQCLVQNNIQSPWEFYAYWPEWPDTPYLRIKQDVRRKYWKAWTGRDFSDSPQLEVCPISYLLSHREVLWGELKNTEHAGQFASAKFDRTGEIITFEGTPHSGQEIAAFVIRYHLSDEGLKRRFGRWLTERREANEMPNPETRGEKSDVARLRKELRALGAWRRVHQSGKTYEEAEEYTEQVSGKPSFKGIASWSRDVNPGKGRDCGDFDLWRFCYRNRAALKPLSKRG